MTSPRYTLSKARNGYRAYFAAYDTHSHQTLQHVFGNRAEAEAWIATENAKIERAA